VTGGAIIEIRTFIYFSPYILTILYQGKVFLYKISIADERNCLLGQSFGLEKKKQQQLKYE
jgi:hypothetical protein